MRNKLFILLALFVAFSAASYAQDNDDHTVSTTLVEIRNLSLNGTTPIIAIRRDPGVNWIQDNTTTMILEHNLLVPQQVTVETDDPGAAWVGRYLSVQLVGPVNASFGLNGGAATGWIELVADGVYPTNGAAAQLITGIGETDDGTGTLGPTPANPIAYRARGDLTAIPGDTDQIVVTYTILDD